MKNWMLALAGFAVCSTISAADVSVITVNNGNTDTTIEEIDSGNCPCAFKNYYIGISSGFKSAQLEASLNNIGYYKHTHNNAIGSLFIGTGAPINLWYIGGEVVCDFTKNDKKEFALGNQNWKIQNGGIVPNFTIRGGRIIPASNLLVYIKTGISLFKDKLTYTQDDTNVKLNKVAPLLAAGFEKIFCKKFSFRGEAEYNFKADKSSTFVNIPAKLKNKGTWNIRLMLAYNVKI